MRLPQLAVCLFLIITLPCSAHAASFTGIDGMTSTVMQEHQSSFSGLGLRAHFQPERVVKELDFMPSVEYWRMSSTVQTYDVETMRKDATLAFDVRYRFEMSGWHPYVGMGYGLHFLTTRVNAPTLGLNNASNSVVKGGLAALGGVIFELSPKFDNFIELKYHHVTDYRQLKINWGIAYKM